MRKYKNIVYSYFEISDTCPVRNINE